MVLENMRFECQSINQTLPFCSEFPPCSRNDIKNSILPSSIGLQNFFLNGLADFWKYFPVFLRVPHIRLNIGPAVNLTVRQSFSLSETDNPSVRQSLYNLQSFSEPSPGSGLVFQLATWLVMPGFILNSQRILEQGTSGVFYILLQVFFLLFHNPL